MAGFTDFVAPWGANTAKEYATAMGTGVVGAPGQFAGVLGGMYDSINKGYGSYNQGLASLGNSYAQNYGAMAGGIGQIANALGNTWNNAQAQNPYASSAEAARQMGVANLGTAAMTAYGQAAGAGMQAWAQNQQGYQKALADMTGANQTATSGLGQARMNALANLGKSASVYGLGNSIAGALPGLASGFGGGQATAGPIDMRGWGALDSLRGDINSQTDANRLTSGYQSALDSLNGDQAVARGYPERQISTSYDQLMNLNRMNLDASSHGMDQFYENYGPYQQNAGRPGQRIPTGSLLDALAGGYTDSANRITGVQSDMKSGWADNKGIYGSSTKDVKDLFGGTIGNLGLWDDPMTAQTKQWQLDDARKSRDDAARRRAFADSTTPAMTPQQMRRFISTGVYS